MADCRYRIPSVIPTAKPSKFRVSSLVASPPPLQLRKLPPMALQMGILDKSALKMAAKAVLGEKTPEELTPFAAKEYEAQRNNSRS